MPDEDVTPPAILRDFQSEMIVDPPAVPVDEGTDRTALDGRPLILPVDPDQGPADLEDAVQAAIAHVAEQALEQLNGTDPQLYGVRSKVRAVVGEILADHSSKVADIRNRAQPAGPTPEDGDAIRQLGFQNREDAEGLAPDHPNRKALEAIERRIRARGTLTSDGARLELQDAAAQRDSEIQDRVEQWREKLDRVEARCVDVINQGTIMVGEEDRRSAVLLAHELAATSPRHGLPILRQAVREAAVDPANLPTLAAALPALRSMYENERSPYAGSVQLRQLIGAANDLLQSPEAIVARARLERVEQTRWEIDEWIKNARDGGTEALDSEGRPVLLPPERPPASPPMPRAAPYEFRRAHSAAQREADEQRRRALREAPEE